jgi:putative nucleotidyltransferase with HDIG domain
MVKSIEARDPYTSGHSQRVSRSAAIIARAAGLSPVEVERVRIAGLLHDIGKIEASLGAIITKPGRLTEDEFALMKTHPDKGAELVSTITHLQDLVPAIRHHHERWEGGGYPMGIAGDSIPLGARIISLADTVDAMMSDRAYRTRRSIEEIRDEVIRCRGTQFDPILADCVVAPDVWNRICSVGPAPQPNTKRTPTRLRVLVGSAVMDAS